MLNKATLIGRLGADPETRYTNNGSAVTNVNLATTEKWKDKQSGQMQERTEWHRLVFFGRQAEVAGQYLTKGSLIYVEGRIQTQKWQDQNGQDRYTTQVVCNQMQILTPRSNGQGNGANGGQQQPQQRPQPQQAQQAQQAQQPQPQQSGPEFFDDGMDDDIPF